MDFSLDIRTLNAVAALTSVFTSVGLLVAWGALPKRSSLAYWAAGYVLLAVGFLLLWSRETLPHILALVAGNLLLAAGAMLIVLGAGKFLDIAGLRWLAPTVLGSTALALVYLVYIHPSIQYRIVLMSAVFAGVAFAGAWRIASAVHPGMRFVQCFVAALALTFGALMVLRIVGTLLLPPGPDYFTPSLVMTGTYVAYLLLLPCIGFGLLSMVYKKLAWELRQEVALREASEQALLAAKRNLEFAIAEMKTLKGIIPICSVCKNIRDDRGLWKQLEEYISTRSEAEFSHSICPECAREMYPDLSLNDG